MMCPGLAVGWVQAASMAARLWANAATWWHPAHNGSGALRAAVGGCPCYPGESGVLRHLAHVGVGITPAADPAQDVSPPHVLSLH